MPRINVNLNEVEGGFPLLPEDKYLVEIQDTSKLMKSDAGPYIRWIAKVVEGEYADKFIGWNTSLLPQALWNVKNMLEAANVDWEEDGFDTEDVIGALIIVDVSQRTIEQGRRAGELGNQVDGYYMAEVKGKKK